MKKIIKLLGLSVFTAAVVVGCSSPSVDTGGEGNNVEAGSANKGESKQDEDAVSFKSGETVDVHGLKIKIGEVKITPNKIEVGLSFENTTQDVTWYPDLGSKAVVGDMQLDMDPLHESGLSDGEIGKGIKSDGSFVFSPPGDKKLDPKKIDKIDLKLGEVTDPNYNEKKLDISIPVLKK